MARLLEQMSAPGSTDEPVASVCLAGSVRHAVYVKTGATVGLPDGQSASLGGLLLVVDCDRWATLHRISGIYRRGGERGVKFGPRVPWPDGSTAARRVAEEEMPDGS